MGKEKKKAECYKSIYEPMLNLEIRVYIWEKGEKEYNDLLLKVSGRWLHWEVGNTITEPIECDEWWVFWAMWVYDETDYRYFIHELYHLTNAIKETYDLWEEWWAYLIWWLAGEIL